MKRSSVMSTSLLVLACLLVCATAQSFENVDAHWADIDAKEHDWDMNAAEVLCRTWDADKPYEWRSQYNWTNIAEAAGHSIQDDCGKCILVTNPVNKKEAIVRIVGSTGRGIELDKVVFDELDSDGTGADFNVNYTFVDCDRPVPPVGPGETNVTAYWSDYHVKENNWTYDSHDACAALDGNKPLDWRKKYGWTGYCGIYGTKPEDICGKCLKVTNTDTKEEVIVRIVDTCGSAALELDYETAFKPIDSDGKGKAQGHLIVDYEFVNCDDSILDSPLLVYSE